MPIQEQSAIEVLDGMVDDAKIGHLCSLFENNGSPEAKTLAEMFCTEWKHAADVVASSAPEHENLVAFSRALASVRFAVVNLKRYNELIVARSVMDETDA